MQELDQKGIDINQLLLGLLNKREEEIEQQKEKIVEEIERKNAPEQVHIRAEVGGEAKSSRYIPVKIKRIITLEHGTKCSIPTYAKPSQIIHHTQRLSLTQHVAPHLAHNPRYLAPLCKEHHIIAHSIDLKFHEKSMR